MNYSIYSADRTTHLKIVVVALAASIMSDLTFVNGSPVLSSTQIK